MVFRQRSKVRHPRRSHIRLSPSCTRPRPSTQMVLCACGLGSQRATASRLCRWRSTRSTTELRTASRLPLRTPACETRSTTPARGPGGHGRCSPGPRVWRRSDLVWIGGGCGTEPALSSSSMPLRGNEWYLYCQGQHWPGGRVQVSLLFHASAFDSETYFALPKRQALQARVVTARIRLAAAAIGNIGDVIGDGSLRLRVAAEALPTGRSGRDAVFVVGGEPHTAALTDLVVAIAASRHDAAAATQLSRPLRVSSSVVGAVGCASARKAP